MTAAQRKVSLRKYKVERFRPNTLLRRFLIFVFFFLLFGAAAQAFSSWQGRLWKDNARFTVVVAEEDPKIYSFDAQSGGLTITKIPAKTQIQASHGLGSWLVGSLWELGWQEGKRGDILANSLKKSLGIPVDAWIDKEGVRTNLTLFDRIRFLGKKGTEVSNRELDLEALRVLEKRTFDDGVEGFLPVPEQAKVVFERNFRDEAVFQEAKTTAVVNTTDKAGLGAEVARLATILGVRVINVSSREEGIDEDCVVSGKKEDVASKSARRLGELLGCQTREKEGETLEVLLGEGFAQRF